MKQIILVKWYDINADDCLVSAFEESHFDDAIESIKNDLAEGYDTELDKSVHTFGEAESLYKERRASKNYKYGDIAYCATDLSIEKLKSNDVIDINTVSCDVLISIELCELN